MISLNHKFFKIRKILVVGWLIIILIGISSIFWFNEIIYNLPTPVPPSYKDIKIGTHIGIIDKFIKEINKPVFIHFYNPKCPCSRFNVPYIQSLIKQYGGKISFVVVLINNELEYTEEEIQGKFGSKVPVIIDKSIATACGVYSTPQAVILNVDRKLYYRGNYNKNRYCTDKKSNYAQMAIDSILNNKSNPTFNSSALKAYGCQLPECKNPN